MRTKVKAVLRRKPDNSTQYRVEAIQGAVILELSALRIGPIRVGDLVDEATVKTLTQVYQITVRS